MTAVSAPPLPEYLLSDPKLHAVPAAWTRAGRAGLLREALPHAGLAGELERIAIADMTYSPTRQCIVLYAVRLAGEGVDRWVVGSFAHDDRLATPYARWYARRPGAALLLDARCLVEVFPSDWKLSRLAPAIDSEVAGRILGRVAGVGSGPATVTVLRYRPHERCVVRYDWAGTAIIAKVFRDPEKAATSSAVMRALHARSRALRLAVPTPLAFVRSRTLLLMEHLEGTSVKGALRVADEETAAELTDRAASALVALHTLRVSGGEERSFETELAQLRQRTRKFAAVAPLLATRVDDVLTRLESLAPRLSWRGRSFVHGDFKPSQLLLDGDHLALVDFDRAARGDPALDVGNFMAQFRKETLTGGSTHLRALPERFLAAYDDRSPRKAVAARARTFEALALARMAVRSFRRSPHRYARRGPSSLPCLLLEEAARCLEAL